MKLNVNARSGVPIYRQLVEQLERAISGGLLVPGEQLPTVRELALELTVNPNTVARAYRELEQSGLLDSTRGRGTFVANRAIEASSAEKEEKLRQRLEELLLEAWQLKIDRLRLEALFREAVVKYSFMCGSGD